MLIDDIKLIELCISAHYYFDEKYKLAWQRIKKHIEAQNTAHNPSSPKFQWNLEEPKCNCGGKVMVVQVKYRCDCGRVFRKI